jgi:MFS family permease
VLSTRPRAEAPPGRRARLFTPTFILFLSAWISGSLAHGLLFWAVVPYIGSVGLDSGLGGLGLALISLTALVSRVPIGRLVDRYGGRRPACAGAATLMLSALVYATSAWIGAPQSARAALVLVALMLHGAGLSALGTASFTYLGIMVDPSRRGEAVGYYGAATPLISGFAAALVYAAAGGGFVALYAGVAVVAALSVVLFWVLAELEPGHLVEFSVRGLLAVGRAVGLPAAINGILAVTNGASRVAVPIAAIVAGTANPGLFFLAMALAGTGLRLVSGRVSDRFGRRTVALPGIVSTSLAFAFLALSAGWGDTAFLISGAVYGLATASSGPALQAMVLDREPEDQRGASAAAMWMLLDVGMGVGTLLAGLVATASDASGGLILATVAPLISLALLLLDAGIGWSRADAATQEA